MEQTLGKRIMTHRKRLGMTQDQLAEKLGVTAQAVSKWENDQSCPDITILPKLAEIFQITADVLLGMEKETVHEAEVITVTEDSAQTENIPVHKGTWEFRFDSGKRNAVCFAILVLWVGSLLLVTNIYHLPAGLWDLLWPSVLLVFGLFGILPKFSFFHLGCVLFGGYYLLDNLDLLPGRIGGNIVLPVIIILFGLSLLADALRKPQNKGFHVFYNADSQHREVKKVNFETDDESFTYSASFSEGSQRIDLPKMNHGQINISFGEYIVDLSGIETISNRCTLETNCSFGSLTLHVPKCYQVYSRCNTIFANVSTKGHPDTVTAGAIQLDGNVSFGQITIQYI